MSLSKQFADLLMTDPADPTFFNKARSNRSDLVETFAKPVVGLSEGVLLLSGFYPGPWLNQIPWNANLTATFKDQWKIFEQAKNAIRSGILVSATSEVGTHGEGTIYYVKLPDLCRWFLKENVDWIAEESCEYVINLLGGLPKKKGRPKGDPEIVERIAIYFQEQGIKHLPSIELLRTTKAIAPLVQQYLKRKQPNQITRSLQTLRLNVNKLLVPKPK